MTDSRQSPKGFREGYIEGWRSVTKLTTLPSIPSHAIPAGKTDYEYGLELGKARGLEWIGREEKPKSN